MHGARGSKQHGDRAVVEAVADSALIETSEAPQISPAEAPSSAPPRGLARREPRPPQPAGARQAPRTPTRRPGS